MKLFRAFHANRRDVRRLVTTVALSDVCLIVLFASEDIMRHGGGGARVDWARTFGMYAVDWTTWGVLTAFVVAVGLTHRLDDSAARVRNVAVWIGLAIGCCLVQGAICGVLLQRWGLLGNIPPMLARASTLKIAVAWTFSSLAFNLVFFAVLAGAFHATVYYRDLQTRTLQQTDLEARLARAELNVLRMQLQPHFLFNALHTVSSLMETDVPTARSVITALGDLLRASIDHIARQEVQLRAEMEFVARYLEIQQARFRQRLTVDVQIADDVLDALVPSLILQPLVENAIRHGVEPFPSGGRIWISASRQQDCVLLIIRDNGHASPRAPKKGPNFGTGIGLSNVEARLAQLYGGSYEFTASREESGNFVARMVLPYHVHTFATPSEAG